MLIHRREKVASVIKFLIDVYGTCISNVYHTNQNWNFLKDKCNIKQPELGFAGGAGSNPAERTTSESSTLRT